MGGKGVHAFPKGINPKVNVIGWLEFELAYTDVVIEDFNHYATGIPPVSNNLLSLFAFIRIILISQKKKKILIKR